MLAEFLQVSGLIFWLVAGVAAGLVAIATSKDNEVGALVIAGIALLAMFLFTDAPAHVSPWALLLIPLYFAIGVAYAIRKWRGLIRQRKTEAAETYKIYTANPRPVAGPNQLSPAHESFAEWAKTKRPAWNENKERIAGWIGLWPWSLAWQVLKFPWRLVVWIGERFRGMFERMSERLWNEA
jgi:fucose 4-O-acetylase-like acetyltransferase